MVDAGAGIFNRSDALPAEAPRLAVAPPMSVAEYLRFAATHACAPAQSAAWVDSWTRHVDGDHAFIFVGGDDLNLALPIEIVLSGPFRVARFLSGSHANGNFPPFAERAAGLSAASIAAAVRKARPDIDLLHLERLASEQDGVPNPLLPLAAQESPNVALAVSLHGGFDALLARTSGKRKRKKHRSQTRKFEVAGGHRRVEARTQVEVDAFLDAFFVMKAERFRRMGVADVFADPGVQAAFRAIFSQALADPERPFVLHALEVGNKLRAITGSSRCGERLVCEFGAIAEDDMTFASPGEFLFFENIREACEEGFAVYDFSVGDEHYKRLWCDVETRHFDMLLPLTARGRALAAFVLARSRLKRFVKQNRFIWGVVKRLRRNTGATAASQEDDGE